MLEFMAKLIGAILGAVIGFTLAAMLIVEIHGEAINLHFIGMGVGALLGFGLGHLISNGSDQRDQTDFTEG